MEGVITNDGLFDGFIRTKAEEFYIEPASRYSNLNSSQFHTIIYRVPDALLSTFNSSKCFNSSSPPSSSSLPLPGNSCLPSVLKSITLDVGDTSNYTKPEETSNQTYYNRLRRDIENSHSSSPSSVDQSSSSSTPSSSFPSNLKLKQTYWRDFDSLNYEGDTEAYGIRAVQRAHWPEERPERHFVIDPKKTTCMLYLQADHLFYEKLGSEEACIETMTRHVQKVNNIYRSTGKSKSNHQQNIRDLICFYTLWQILIRMANQIISLF